MRPDIQKMTDWSWATVGNAIVESLVRALEIETEKETAYQEAKKVAELHGEAVPIKRGNSEVLLTTGKAIEGWRNVTWSLAETVYRKTLSEYVSTTRLLGNPKPVAIDQLYTDLFVFRQLSAFRRTELKLADPGVDPYMLDEPHSRQDALDLVRTGGHLYIVGHPGAGKTTFLRYLAILACSGSITRLPLYIPLRDVVSLKLTVAQYIAREFDICNFPETSTFTTHLLRSRNTLLLIDGLDEIEDSLGNREPVILEIKELARRHDKCQLVVTCRIASSSYAFERFVYAEVAHFTEQQQRTFISKWYGADHKRRDRILQSWGERRVATLRDLAKTPLLLALICLAFDELDEIPERHVDLYRESLDALMKKWDVSRNVRRDPFYCGLKPYRREQLIQELATDLHQKNKILFSPTEVAKVVAIWFDKLPDPAPLNDGDTTDLLDQIEAQHGLIVQRARGIYSFSHLSLQEYFAARSIAEGHPFNTIERITSQYALEPRWREVFIFLAGMLPDGTTLLESIRSSITKTVSADELLGSLIKHVDNEFYAEEARYKSGLEGGGSRDRVSYEGADPAIHLASTLQRRVNSLAWLRKSERLLIKLNITNHTLLLAEANVQHPLRPLVSGKGDGLIKYLQAALLLVDCAAIAVCSNRERAVAWLFSPQFS